MNELISNDLIDQIKTLLEASRKKIAIEVNTTLLHTYWQIGKIIVEDEALHIGDLEYEKQSLRQLSKALTTEFGKGFSRSNLSNMRQFYLTHKDVQTASGQLSWSHYCELQAISDEQKRSFMKKSAATPAGRFVSFAAGLTVLSLRDCCSQTVMQTKKRCCPLP